VAEWSKAPDSKSGIRQRIVGSNPTLSASGAPCSTAVGRGAKCKCVWYHGEVDERLKSHAWKACLG
jgi:hypothetical protein